VVAAQLGLAGGNRSVQLSSAALRPLIVSSQLARWFAALLGEPGSEGSHWVSPEALGQSTDLLGRLSHLGQQLGRFSSNQQATVG
jgi:hypothetical protein